MLRCGSGAPFFVGPPTLSYNKSSSSIISSFYAKKLILMGKKKVEVQPQKQSHGLGYTKTNIEKSIIISKYDILTILG